MLDALQYRVLKTISPGEPDVCSGAAFEGRSKIEMLLGVETVRSALGKTVIDFGCGYGHEAVELAQAGAKKVIGLDIREEVLEPARAYAKEQGVADICEFTSKTSAKADLIVSIDAFEHFDNPAGILAIMKELLSPKGFIAISFGPPWYHPLGGHLFSVFPWAHLLFSERALTRWRSDFKSDGAKKFEEVAGGLNQMTIHRFENLVRNSGLDLRSIEYVPIRKFRAAHSKATREFTTAIVRCVLSAPSSGHTPRQV